MLTTLMKEFSELQFSVVERNFDAVAVYGPSLFIFVVCPFFLVAIFVSPLLSLISLLFLVDIIIYFSKNNSQCISSICSVKNFS